MSQKQKPPCHRDPDPFCPCGKSPGRAEYEWKCTACWNGTGSGPSMEAKYNRKPTIDELNAKHEMIVKDMIKCHETDKELFDLERARFRQEKIIYEMKIEELQNQLRQHFAESFKPDLSGMNEMIQTIAAQNSISHKDAEELVETLDTVKKMEKTVAAIQNVMEHTKVDNPSRSTLLQPTKASQARKDAVTKKKVSSK